MKNGQKNTPTGAVTPAEVQSNADNTNSITQPHDNDKGEFRALYSIIPASVRDDASLRPRAVLLYGEISARCHANGYCWPSNASLGKVMQMSPRSVEALLSQLERAGHIGREVLRDDKGAVYQRNLWVIGCPGTAVPPTRQIAETSPSNSGYPTRQITDIYNNNITSNNNTPYSPPQGDAQKQTKQTRRIKTAPDWEPERFENFWKYYPVKKAKAKAIASWDRLKPSNELIDSMALALVRMVRYDAQWQQGIGIPHAATWLNQRRWEDVPQTGGTQTADTTPGVVEREEVYLLE